MGKSSGGIRNAGKNPRKSKMDENGIKVDTGVFGENENWRITSKKSDLIGIFPKKLYSKDEAIKSFLEKINRSENKKVQKVSTENLLKSALNKEIEKEKENLSKLETKLFEAKLKSNARFNNLGFGSGMRLSKINVSFRKEDEIKEKIENKKLEISKLEKKLSKL